MSFVRVGDKLLDRERIDDAITSILRMRADGCSQQEVADRVGVDRTFVSRLESLGEVRKGGRVALIGFPVGNKDELTEVARQEGVELIILLTDRERWEFIESRSGIELFNEIMNLIYSLQDYRSVIFIGSDMRIGLVKAMLHNQVIGIEIGKSPLREDKWVDVERVRSILRSLRS